MPTTFLKHFLRDEDGAVTIDWVVLTAGTIVLGILTVSAISSGATDMSTGLGSQLAVSKPPKLDFTQLTP